MNDDTTSKRYVVKCDECKNMIRFTDDVTESYRGGTCDACNAKPIHKGFSRAEMSAAFDAVKNPENWKMPGTGIIDSDKFDVTAAAVEFYAGGGLQVVKRDGDQTVVTFPGYYALIGA